MGLYFGNKKVSIYSDTGKMNLQLYSSVPIVNGILLKSSDDFALKDFNNLYLTAKEGE